MTIVSFFLTAGFFRIILTIVSRKGVVLVKKFSPERLMSRRKMLGKTQKALSAEAGLSTVSISAIENGRKEPRAGTLARLARALRCGVDYFYA